MKVIFFPVLRLSVWVEKLKTYLEHRKSQLKVKVIDLDFAKIVQKININLYSIQTKFLEARPKPSPQGVTDC